MTHAHDQPRHVAIVTGANHGIGEATARKLASAGCAVLVTYLRTFGHEQELATYRENRLRDGQAVAALINAAGGRAIAAEIDLTEADSACLVFDRAEEAFGRADILVHNATGQQVLDTFGEIEISQERERSMLTADAIDANFAVDARAGALLIQEFAQRHRASGAYWGRIVALTSGGSSGFPGEVTYGAAKAALENYVMSAATELGSLGITANLVYPPVTDTGWVTDEVRALVQENPEFLHVASPADVAEVIAWLCSDAARMVTGNIVRMR